MSAMRVPTVQVHHLGGDFSKRGSVVTINRSDFDEAVHHLLGDVAEGDADAEGDDYESLSLSDMKALLRKRGHAVRGNPNEATLLSRLREDD